MKLEGKFKEDFFEWLLKTHEYYVLDDNEDAKHLPCDYGWFVELPQSAQFGLIQEYCDTIGYYITTYPIDIFDDKCHGWGFMIEKYNMKDKYNDRLDSRQEAQTEAVNKVMEIVNK